MSESTKAADSHSERRKSNQVPFSALEINEKTKSAMHNALGRKKMKYLRPIQAAVIPHALQGRDILASAQTGSGKTLAFLIPVIDNMITAKFDRSHDGCGALILTPTHDLAHQILRNLEDFFHKTRFTFGLAIGGSGKSLEKELDGLRNTNVIVATPGRLLDLARQGLNLDNCSTVVIDEVDLMLEKGFDQQIQEIRGEFLARYTDDSGDSVPKLGEQTLMFSATIGDRVRELADEFLVNPERVLLVAREKLPSTLVQRCAVVPLERQLNFLVHFINTHSAAKIVVFFSTIQEVKFYYGLLGQLKANADLQKGNGLRLHGRLYCRASKQSNNVGFRSIEAFKECKAGVLLTTDVITRGIDCDGIQHVLMFHAPSSVDEYIHRAGRTARAGRNGEAIVLLDSDAQKEAFEAKLREKGVLGEEGLAELRTKGMKTINAYRTMSESPDFDKLTLLATKAYQSFGTFLAINPFKPVYAIKRHMGGETNQLVAYGKSIGLLAPPDIKIKSLRDAEAKAMLKRLHGQQKIEGDSAGLKALMASVDSIIRGESKGQVRKSSKSWGEQLSVEVDTIAGADDEDDADLKALLEDDGDMDEMIGPAREIAQTKKDVKLSKSQMRKKLTKLRKDGTAAGPQLHENIVFDDDSEEYGEKVTAQAVAERAAQLAQTQLDADGDAKRRARERLVKKRKHRAGHAEEDAEEANEEEASEPESDGDRNEEIRIVGAGKRARVETQEELEARAMALLGAEL
ncbi:DEAD/DEAH box helicase [Carpediemonas membranifera]|uniref:ATP-dependent RNA helicase n=1 Tax=Carpediemonas membranifera TaxID=201153 RepID=A0A8J6E1T0_9EUKA|nr:DEAD/DEAH box helicase [Carpediemonas membranifera]|eukprot:KAG9396759.1 DEAD/DEAH box helicase [Carpediemonas membranifera]